MKKIVGLFRPVPKTKNSHNAAWAHHWGEILNAQCCVLNDDYSDAEHLYLYIDINYQGTVNLFDGLSEDIFNRLNKLLKFYKTGKKITVIDYEMPDLKSICKGRQHNKSTYGKFTNKFISELEKMQKNIDTITMSDLKQEFISLGDSHSMSVAERGQEIIRLDAKTLAGALHSENGNFIKNRIPDGVKKVRLMFGSVDMRHHVFRKEDPKKYVDELLSAYLEKIKELQKDYIIEVHGLVPVEHEERKMAGTIMFKKEPFAGSRKERLEMTKYFNKELEKFPCDVYQYPDEWFDMDGTVFAEKIMEKPRGIHIGESHYRKNNFGVIESDLDSW